MTLVIWEPDIGAEDNSYWRKDFSNTSFAGKDLSNFRFYDCDFSKSSFDGALLKSTLFHKCDFDGTSFRGATLYGLKTLSIRGIPKSLPSGWCLTKGWMIGPGVKLAGVNLRSANLAGVDLSEADIRLAMIEDVDFSNASLHKVLANGLRGEPAKLPANWRVVSGYFVGPHSDLRNANFAGADLEGAHLEGSYLHEAILEGSTSGGIVGTPASLPTSWKIKSGYLIGPKAQLMGRDLSGLQLEGVNLRGANLKDAVMKDVNLSGADLSFADMRGVDLLNSKIDGTIFENSLFTDLKSAGLIGVAAVLPTKWAIRNGYLIGPSANLDDSDLHDLDLKDQDLTAASLNRACLCGTNLEGASLSNANLEEACFDNTNLSKTKLSDAHVSGAFLAGAIFGETETNYKKIAVSGVPASIPPNCKLSKGYLLVFGSESETAAENPDSGSDTSSS